MLDRIGPGALEHGPHLQRHIVYIEGQGFQWLDDPKHFAAIMRNRSKTGAKPQSSPGSEDLGRSDPEVLDELAEVEAKLYQQDTGISICVSSGRFDIQFCVKRLSEMMPKPRKLGNLRLARLARYFVGTQKLMLRFDHKEFGDIVRIPVDSDRAGSCVRSSASLEFRRSRALRNRGWLGTRNVHEALLRGEWDEPSTSMSRQDWKDKTHPSSMPVDPRRRW